MADSQNVTNLDYVLYRYGFALAKAGDFAGSSSVYKPLSTSFPSRNIPRLEYWRAGQTLMREKRFAEAAEYFKRLLPAKDERALRLLIGCARLSFCRIDRPPLSRWLARP